jgi:UDP-N-acetylmuramoyl-L-alanyl-D-glutamate--2,6-diaminopimelate ligase
MTVGELLTDAGCKTGLTGKVASLEVKGIEYDSRRVEGGYLFFAFPGVHADGRRFAGDALARGAVAVVSESPVPVDFPGAWIEVAHGRRALAVASRNWYGRLDERIRLTGITGTNGKTTCGFLVDSILRAAGYTTALVGTIEYHIGGRVFPAVNTTPESLDLHRILAELDSVGGTHATMEVSSHALALGRVYGIEFHTAVFTNLTRDHLDFHQTMEAYFDAKRLLFEGAGARSPLAAVLNRDDSYARQIATNASTQVFWYGLGPDATLRASHISSNFKGLSFDVEHGQQRFSIKSELVGRVNVYNILAACGVGLSYGIPRDVIAKGIAACPSVPGRFERIYEGQPFGVAVDYAHTDDALRNLLAQARTLTSGRVLVVFGCGGDRDRAKRPLMGQAAAEGSDFVVLTSDNPRTEDPLAIINDALVGLRRTDVPHLVEPDRATAIRKALSEARQGDMVVIAGKGHETYQDLGDRKIDFDDRRVATELLKGFGYKK